MLCLNKKSKAFTIAEMLVVLVISSIIITITILVLGLVQSQIKSIQTIYKTNTEIRLLERALWQDFNSHKLFYSNTNELLLCTSEMDTITYVFHESYVVRNLDTIKADIVKKTVFLDGEEVNNNKVDAMELYFSKEIKNKKIFVFKINDVSHYMNY